jgi:hypothetical protein
MSFINTNENKPELQYNYYNILTKKITDNQLSFVGQPNNPNLIIRNGPHDTKYISSKLYLFSKNNSISNKYIGNNSIFGLGFGSGITSDFDAELVVENNSITNSKSNNKVLLCFLLKTNQNNKPNLVDKVVDSNVNSNLEIELNDIVPQNDEYIYHEPNTEFGPKLEDATIIIFKNPIMCKSNFDVLKQISNPFFSNGYMENMIGILNKNITEGLDNASSGPTTDSSGNILLDNGDYLECSVATIDGSDIASYNVALNQQVPRNYITQFTTATYFISTFLIIAVSYYITPSVYSLILRLFAQINEEINLTDLLKNTFIADWTIGSLIFWPAFILFFIGISFLSNKSTNDDTVGYGYVGIAVNILIFLVINIGIIQFKKTVEPTFTGLKYKDGTIKPFDFNDAYKANNKFMENYFVSRAPYRLITSLFGILYIFGKNQLFENGKLFSNIQI